MQTCVVRPVLPKKVNDLDEYTICLQSYDIEFTLFDKDYKFFIDEPDYFTSVMNM